MFFHQMLLSSIKGNLLLSKVVFHQSLSSIKICLLSKVVFYQRVSSSKGPLPYKVIFHQRSSSIKDHLPSKVIFHRRSSSIKGHQVVYMHSPVLHFLQVDFCVVLLVDILVTGEKQSQPLLCTCPRALKKVKSVDSYQTPDLILCG